MTEFIWVKDIRAYPKFYMKMFGVREISNALGLANHCTDCDEWLLVVQEDILLGFSGYAKTKNTFVLKRSFVFPEYRKTGIYKKMLNLRIAKAKELKCNMLQATATIMSRKELEQRGFCSLKKFKKYQTYRLKI
jgi:GNAT superfamily N-acetyltransferase